MDYTLITMWVLLALMAFGILSIKYSIFTHNYIWTISAIFKVGLVPAIVLLSLLAVGIIFFGYFFSSIKENHSFRDKALKSDGTNPAERGKPPSSYLRRCIVGFVNLVTVLVINGLYVSAVNANLSISILITIAILISIFKFLWNWSLRNVFRSLLEERDNIIIGMSLFNNLFAPFLVELFVSPECFLYIVSQAPSVVFDYTQLSLRVIIVDGVKVIGKLTPTTLSIDPAFHYSYQCSSSLVSSYVYVFIIRYLLSVVIEPLFAWWMLSFKSTSPTMQHLIKLLPPLWHLQELSKFDNNIERFNDHLRNWKHSVKMVRLRFVCNIVVDISLLLALGILFPPLALVILFSIWRETMDIKLGLGRFHSIMSHIEDSTSLALMEQIDDTIHAELQRGKHQIIKVVWFGMCIASWIWAFVVFDTFAPAVGNINSIWAVVLVGLYPWILYPAVRIGYRKLMLYRANRKSNEAGVDDDESRMSAMVDMKKSILSEPRESDVYF